MSQKPAPEPQAEEKQDCLGRLYAPYWPPPEYFKQIPTTIEAYAGQVEDNIRRNNFLLIRGFQK